MHAFASQKQCLCNTLKRWTNAGSGGTMTVVSKVCPEYPVSAQLSSAEKEEGTMSQSGPRATAHRRRVAVTYPSGVTQTSDGQRQWHRLPDAVSAAAAAGRVCQKLRWAPTAAKDSSHHHQQYRGDHSGACEGLSLCCSLACMHIETCPVGCAG